MFKQILSYFIPINIYEKKSAISKRLEVTWNNGEIVLDSENTNYSYGSLQRILRKGLQEIGFGRITSIQNILLLGVAGGSVIKTLANEINYKNRITGVEIDPEVIEIANLYFGLDKILNLEIIVDDAFEFILRTKEKYDLIIIDIFQDNVMPNFLFEKFFVDRIASIIDENGFILFNTMILESIHEERNKKFISHLDPNYFTINKVPRLENHNELIIAQKK